MSSDSSLSPPPSEEILNAQAAVTTVQTEVIDGNGRKRKAETTTKTTKRAKTAAVKEEVPNGDDIPEPPKGRKRTTKVKVQKETMENEIAVEGEAANGTTEETPKRRKRATKVKVEAEVTLDENGEEVKVKKKRQKKPKPEDIPPLEPRTMDSKLRVGAHVSIAGGVHHAIYNFVHIGSNAFALFLKSQRKWDVPELDPDHATLFIEGCKKHNFDVGSCCLPHGSYLVNLAHPEKARKEQAYKSFHDDLTRCHKLGIKLYNFHPGNANATTREDGIRLIAENINEAHKDPKTGDVIPVLETMASLGNTIGGTFQDLADIIAHVEDKTRIGVCMDTCHVFAAGYDLRTPESFAAVMKEFDEVIGLKYLKALHVNDSKAPFASHRDLHARIGTGYLGLRAFHNIVNDERLHGLPMILETPIEIEDPETGKKVEDKSIWAREIKMLERLVGMDVESEEFKTMEKKLFNEGAGERERIGEQVERKKKKDKEAEEKKAKKGKGRGRGKKKVETEEEETLEDEDELEEEE